MTVIEINKQVQTIQPVRLPKQEPPQIFIAHCSLSKKLLENIERIIINEKIKPFMANQADYGTNMVEQIVQAVSNSEALFAILSISSFKKQSTRDWIFFELGVAKGIWKKTVSKISGSNKIYVWRDDRIKIPDLNLVKNITEHKLFKMNSKKSRDVMLEEMKTVARTISIMSRTI